MAISCMRRAHVQDSSSTIAFLCRRVLRCPPPNLPSALQPSPLSPPHAHPARLHTPAAPWLPSRCPCALELSPLAEQQPPAQAPSSSPAGTQSWAGAQLAGAAPQLLPTPLALARGCQQQADSLRSHRGAAAARGCSLAAFCAPTRLGVSHGHALGHSACSNVTVLTLGGGTRTHAPRGGGSPAKHRRRASLRVCACNRARVRTELHLRVCRAREAIRAHSAGCVHASSRRHLLRSSTPSVQVCAGMCWRWETSLTHTCWHPQTCAARTDTGTRTPPLLPPHPQPLGVRCTPWHAQVHARVPLRSPAEPAAAPRHPATALAPAQRPRDKWELSEAPCLLLTFGNATPPQAAPRGGERARRDCRSPPPINLFALTKAVG